MTIIIFIIIISILVYLFISRKKKNFKLKKVLSKSECEEFISMAEKHIFNTTPDPVDKKPMYQIEILTVDRTMHLPELYDKCMKLYKTKLPKQRGSLDFIFLKRYTPGERVDIPLHLDMSESTINILLSNPDDFEGGNFYLFDDKDTRVPPLDKLGSIPKLTEALQKMKDLPIVQLKQGEMINYEGRRLCHGVLPVTSGIRYVLTYFFGHL